ncbi:mcm domain-containing protein 2 [Gigaspora margarita]|uniref:Mcm domain-containing protein 2 n=1 Tax=Gigaspora margarita TaxID=4874 RepID=A0A8H3X1C8_GIGMA|nr:mcm domain-containing protein 2 [Gigaspora margarita]
METNNQTCTGNRNVNKNDSLLRLSHVHSTDRHLLPIEPNDLSKFEKIDLYLRRYHMKAIQDAKSLSIMKKSQLKSNINRYDILLHIDPEILLEFDSILGNDLLNNFVPSNIEDDITTSCMAILQSILGSDDILMPEQVRCKIRLEYLPELPEYRMESIAEVFDRTRHRKDPFFAVFRGIVECLWMPTFIIFSRTFKCENVECCNKNYLHVVPSARANRVIKRTEVGEYSQTSTSTTLHDIDLNCDYCGEEMKEMVVDRIYTTRQCIRISCIKSDESKGPFCNSIIAIMKDDLVNSVEIGHAVEIIGLIGKHFPGLDDSKFCSKSWYDNGLHVKVNNIKKVIMNEIISDHIYSFNDEQHLSILPNYINILKKLNLSAWGFTQRLVDVFCENIVPRFAYRKIKLFLLLSLVALSEKQSKNHCISPSIHIMIISDGYNSIIPKMIRHVSKLKRNGEWTYGNGQKKQPLFIIQNGNSTAKENFIESTILARSQGGILMVNLDSLNKRNVESLRLVMSKSPSLSIQNRYHKLIIDVNTCCWGWSVTRPTGKGINLRSAEDEGIESVCNDPIKPIIDTFDLVTYLKECVDSEANGLLVDHLLDKEMLSPENKKNKFGLSFDDLHKFISIASNIDVKLSTECKDLLRKYFLMCRRLKGASQGFASSTALLETLLRLACCHSKLCLRNVGSVDDALVSILVVEETLVSKYGSSASILGFVSLLDDQENLHKLYACQNSTFGEPLFSSTHSSNNISNSYESMRSNKKLPFVQDVDNLQDAIEEFFSSLCHVSKQDDEKMTRLYQHLVRVLKSFGDGSTESSDTNKNGIHFDNFAAIFDDGLDG